VLRRSEQGPAESQVQEARGGLPDL